MFTLPGSDDPTQYRLPTNVKPIHYNITVKTDLGKLMFDGVVKVVLEIKADTTTITLNSSGLKLGKATLSSDEQKVEQDVEISYTDLAQERVTYKLADLLKAGSKAELKIAYTGKLVGNMMGYYRASWVNGGKAEYYALTQFEPTSARRAFPCWDEPLLKATYAITMISRADTVNLSNMSVQSEESIEAGINIPSDFPSTISPTHNDLWKITKFKTTPVMSSYIVAFANGPFQFLEKSVVMPLSGKNLPLRIYTTPDLIHQAQYALDVKAAVLPVYEKVFDVEYPLHKLDTLVASDFDAGAMENWGLITGRTNALLLDPDRADIKAKKLVVRVQSHEVAHMWFGNITTMEWWDYLYLNEGFATLMGEVIVPEWRVNSEFITSHFSRALDLDSKMSSHPIEVKCPDAKQTNQILEALSYSKAASVLRMLSFYIGQDRFLEGVSLYLKKNLFANSVTHDLWDGISTATGLNITDLIENWITKVGFPVVTVTEDAKGITVRQDRFMETGPVSDEDNETIWNIPLNILSIKDGQPVIDKAPLLQEREKTFALDTSKPFKLNAGTNGVYRVLYTPERLALIAAEAAKVDSVFYLEDRLGLVYDSMALAKAGFTKISSPLNLVDQLKDEKEFLVWAAISNSLTNIKSVWWEHPQITDKLDEFCRSLYAPLVQKLGYDYPEGESIDTSLLRTLVIEKAFEAGDEGVIEELKGRFKAYQDTGDDSNIPADLQRVAYSTATKYGGRKEYDIMTNIYDKPKTPTEQQSAIFAMGIPQDESLLAETFNFISNKARDQDVETFFAGLVNNYKARRPLATFVQDEFDTLYKRYDGNFALAHLISHGLSYFSSEDDYAKIEDFFKGKDTSKYYRVLAQALDGIRAKANFIERSTHDLEEWLSKK